ncbi:MAG: NAD(P)/FAD-dependent oxidoreductase [Deltaproteobacteria bacterium]|nr:NAD(P)/FAD-dependent oxidoreductase [Deltaproteobacteria bacterium]
MSGNVAVIGAGFGGLSTAIVLARLGLRVTLIEGEARAGGVLRSYTREGVDCPVGVHYFGSAAPGELLGDFFDVLQIRSALRLRRMGQGGVIDRFFFDDEVFELPDTAERFEANLMARFPDAPEAVAFVMRVCRAAMASLRTDTPEPVPPLLPMTRTAAEVLAEMNLPRRLVDILALQGFLLGVDLSVCPAAFLLMATASLLMSAWELGCTGAEMAEALTRRALALGTDLIVGDAATEILVKNGRAAGVRLQSGRTIPADTVAAAIHPKTTVGLLGPQTLPASYREGIGRLRETDGILCVTALLDEEDHPPLDHNLYRVRGSPSRRLAGVYGQLRPAGLPGKTRLTVLAETTYAEWARWHDTTTGRREPEYRAEKARRAAQALREIEEVTGPLRQPRIIDVWTPLTMRDWVAAPEGCTYGAKHSARDGLDFLVLCRPPLPGLFLVGQNAIAPGLLGVSMGVLRVAASIAGRQPLADLMARSRGRATS